MVDKAPVYCDIGKFLTRSRVVPRTFADHYTAIRIQIGLNVAISACSLCINRRLYKIATAKGLITEAEKRRDMTVDLLIGLGIPILQIIIGGPVHIQPQSIAHMDDEEYIVSGHRYNLFEDFGPSYSIVNMPPSYFLFYAWPLMIGCVSFVYSCECPGLPFHMVPKLNSHSIDHLSFLQARSTCQADQPWHQS